MDEIKGVIDDDFIGFYIHGSLAMGGFNPKSSDIDVLVVTNETMIIETKERLVKLFLNCSNDPFPVEISFVNKEQLKNWEHPFPFDFHFSEFWRRRYERDLSQEKYQYINAGKGKDPDLAAHITITTHRGICLEGPPIHTIFPTVPRSHYISSIIGDYRSCIEEIQKDPIYCVLNIVRVYWYLKDGKISSKQEAGNWGKTSLSEQVNLTVHKAVHSYVDGKGTYEFDKDELLIFRNVMSRKIQEQINFT
ncbi:aminoglycoside adenylyltransferase domain-containing protein [Halobacillus naozhouensis]|uniref:Spectinomycin 9-adenylyltransferase n=1 Tax=Halobacillus naozhouensis TaxID=554880 RepID=A0ABY8J6C7_9BACI|nr:aminoglycoside adenylyltransferase domain-containing protein [Halobacillus naozhouensis]WFT76511.1 DUF4111 domain-containing protein [Halobacillus naozhouensis]